MIRFDQVSFTYEGATAAVLADVSFAVPEGDLCVVAGPTGVGKSTLLGAVNGLVPRFTGGRLDGRVTVAGRDTASRPPREFADLVGVVGQDPLAGFVTDTVEDELAYGMEQLGLPAAVMRKRVEETLDLLGLADLRERQLATLSGGEQQRVAIGAVLTAHPRVLVLDEPTSALDPTAAEDVLATLTRLVHDLGMTALVAEHRLERIVQYADHILEVPGDGSIRYGDPATVLATAAVAPPVVELGRLAGWSPLPLSVRDARRRADALRAELAAAPPPRRDAAARSSILSARGISVRYGDTIAVRGIDLDLHAGEVTALMGRNGSGKSSLLWSLQGSGRRDAGTVDAGGHDPRDQAASDARRLVGLVPQQASDLFYLSSAADECAQADDESRAASGTCRALLDRLLPGVPHDRHPRDLSEGQRLALVLAIQLTAAPPVLLLDEPTRGLDYGAKGHLAAMIADLVDAGRCVVVATHDVEFVATVADRVVVMAEGELVADGPAVDVLAASPAFAPQVAKILAPDPWLTVAEVAAALPETRAEVAP
ncbi:MAG: ATP-binding cassette domain-containing protein [Actinobacteria bacterium]|nr:ATP-binding cassette domain-containing protein [Actinomycetota bacterium]